MSFQHKNIKYTSKAFLRKLYKIVEKVNKKLQKINTFGFGKIFKYLLSFTRNAAKNFSRQRQFPKMLKTKYSRFVQGRGRRNKNKCTSDSFKKIITVFMF